ncbi:MAG: hypothetical protein L3J39_05330 [Verrucomicrobiales bacterium]|nr:hypothetical protein [Verrucomicrobiales bacterium]
MTTEASQRSNHPKSICLAVLNPGGRDTPVDYSDGPGEYQPGIHPPINYHAYAAATRGKFFDSVSEVLKEDRFDVVLVLIRRRVKVSLKAIQALKNKGRKVWVAWKEAGPYQITEQLNSSKILSHYQEILALADGVLSPCSILPPRWGWISAADFSHKTRFIPTPYPVEFPQWDFSTPVAERQGVMIGTREFFAPLRNHLRTLAEAARLCALTGEKVTVINGDKSAGRKILRQLEESFPESRLQIIDRPLAYDDYLHLMASHRLVFQLDRGSIPGQVAGDALLCRTLCAGGNSAIEELTFPDLCDDSRLSLSQALEKINQALSHSSNYQNAVDASQSLASEEVSYTAVAQQLYDFMQHLDQHD